MADETLDKITQYLNENSEGVPSKVLGEKFLALTGGNEMMTNMMVEAVVKKSPLIWKENGLWFAKEVDSPLVGTLPFLICYPLLSHDRRTIIQLVLLKVEGEDREQIFSFRLEGTDPIMTTRNEMVVNSINDVLPILIAKMREGRLLFPAQYEQRLLLKYALDAGFSLPENALLLSHLYKMTGIPMNGRNGGVVGLAEGAVAIEQEPVNALDYAEITADLFYYLLEKMGETGVATEDQFSARESEETLGAVWTKAQFTLDDIRALEERPGVYGYQDEQGNYIYVGKGANVRTRLTTYFRVSDESPAKLTKLREDAVTFTCHYCGNELEAIILESRLIKKYNPPLNTQVDIHAPKESVAPIPQGIYLLPAQSEENCYTLWYNGTSHSITKTVSRAEEVTVAANELEQFFLKSLDNKEQSQETLLIERWLRPRLVEIDRIEVDNCHNGNDILALLSEAVIASTGEGTIYR